MWTSLRPVNLRTAASISGGRLRFGTSYAAPCVTAALAAGRLHHPCQPLADPLHCGSRQAVGGKTCFHLERRRSRNGRDAATRRKELERQLSASSARDPLRIHPRIAKTYRARIGQLIAGLAEAERMDEAKEALRTLVEKIELVPVAAGKADTGVPSGKPGLAIHLHDALASLLRLACGLPVHEVSGAATQMQKAPRIPMTTLSPKASSISGLTRPHRGHGPLHMFKTEVIKFLGPWRSVGQVEWETLKWVDWYNNTRLHSAIGYVTPNEAEEAFCASLSIAEKAA